MSLYLTTILLISLLLPSLCFFRCFLVIRSYLLHQNWIIIFVFDFFFQFSESGHSVCEEEGSEGCNPPEDQQRDQPLQRWVAPSPPDFRSKCVVILLVSSEDGTSINSPGSINRAVTYFWAAAFWEISVLFKALFSVEPLILSVTATRRRRPLLGGGVTCARRSHL